MSNDRRRLRLLLNATVLTRGGSLQAAVNFVEQALKDTEIDWFFAVSHPVHAELRKAFPGPWLPSDRLLCCNRSPARSPAARRLLYALAAGLRADAVFTLFGPAYVRFPEPHIMGFANSWLTHPNKLALSALGNPLRRFRFSLSAAYKRHWLCAADLWVVETEAARVGLHQITGIDPQRILVVPNGCRDEFRQIRTATDELTGTPPVVRILYVSSYYPHKNFEIIPAVARSLQTRLGKDAGFEFVLTLDPGSTEATSLHRTARALGVAARLRFIGRVPVAQVPRLYESAHVAFIPSLLESFSSCYSEALSCGLPIATADLDFAHSICGNAAVYFDPIDPEDAAGKLHRLITDGDLRRALIESGKAIASRLPDANEKYQLYKQGILSSLDSRMGGKPVTQHQSRDLQYIRRTAEVRSDPVNPNA